MARLCKLSEEMVVEILSRLPPKSLMRFKCVRRSWCDLIQNPNFVEKHLSNPKHNKLASSTSIIVKLTVPKGTNIKDKEENFIRNKINLTPDMMDSDELLIVSANGHIVSYNLSTKTRKYVSIRGVDNPRFIQASVYVNSVISVKRDNTIDIL
ncbi:hypothetical protein DVH24_019419 [Malus domestica]|uniref:F-box domain-containing protein n=1 Tax=Malus domestica TaxID=3750 RepID=A0A498I4Z5_MALDO|nr:hypothetical protein DVH24_019419 [Malus domestica]